MEKQKTITGINVEEYKLIKKKKKRKAKSRIKPWKLSGNTKERDKNRYFPGLRYNGI